MTASGLPSLGERVRAEVPLQTFALNCCVSETLSEVVLRAVASAVAAITDHGHNQLSVFLVVCKDLLEPVAQVVEVGLLGDLGLKDARDHGGRRQRSGRNTSINAEIATIDLCEITRLGCLSHEHVQSRRVNLHARFRVASRLGYGLYSISQEFPASANLNQVRI